MLEQVSYFLCSKFQEHRIPFLCLRKELQAASVDPQQLEQQASRAAENWCFRSLPLGLEGDRTPLHRCVKQLGEALAAEHAVQHLGEQRDQLRGELQGTTALSPLVLQNKCTLLLFFETFRSGLLQPPKSQNHTKQRILGTRQTFKGRLPRLGRGAPTGLWGDQCLSTSAKEIQQPSFPWLHVVHDC